MYNEKITRFIGPQVDVKAQRDREKGHKQCEGHKQKQREQESIPVGCVPPTP